MRFLNYQKFAIFNPLSYGVDGGGASLSTYAAIALFFGAVALVAFGLNMSRSPFVTAGRLFARASAGSKVGLIALLVAAIWFVLPNLIRGLYVLIVDLQAYGGGDRPGQIRDEFGYWIFWGLPKKALLQSMPYLALAILPVVAFLNGKKIAGVGFLLLFAAAPIVFFALQSWHGGMAYNLRYYLPAAPFLAILTAVGLQCLRPVYDTHPRLFIRGVIAGLLLSVATYSSAAFYGEALKTPMTAYPQLLLAVALSAVLIALLHLEEARAPRVQFAAAALAAAALGFAVNLSTADVMGYAARRIAMANYDRAYARAIPEGSLVISAAEEMLTRASRAGSAIVSPNPDNIDCIATATGAYEKAGRCVFIHTRIPLAVVDNASAWTVVEIPATAGEEDLALYGLESNPDNCRKE